MKRIALSLLMTAALAGCATIGSRPVPIGRDTYQLSMTGVGFATQADTTMHALREAGAFCDSRGLKMVPARSAESGVYGWSPRQDSLIFMCLRPDDLRYQAPAPMSVESH